MLAKIYLMYLTPSKTDGRVPSQQGAPTTYNLQPDLLGSFPADVSPDITAQFGCGHRAKFSPYIKSNWPLRHPKLSISQQHFPSKDILLVPSLPASKHLLEEPIFWETDPLGAPARWRLRNERRIYSILTSYSYR